MSNSNPYIEKINDYPNIILPFKDDKVTDLELELLNQRTKESSSIICELGMGSGSHLIQLAQQSPSTLFIGFEIRFKRIYSCANQANKLGINNILLLRTYGQKMFELLAPMTLTGTYVNFPDPWAKRRWHKHRLINSDFIKKLAQITKPQGFFSFKTDHVEYFDEVLKVLSANKSFTISRQTLDLHKSEYNVGNVLTEFEKLFISKGLPANYLQAIKIGD